MEGVPHFPAPNQKSSTSRGEGRGAEAVGEAGAASFADIFKFKFDSRDQEVEPEYTCRVWETVERGRVRKPRG
eukprot:CAMPEP_0197857252 /NCGR_PEP_ID=MMETSP1438-20131217/30125_1 /TAXON_ID=1461541 /ORGANISM="Pterosperma sp., Strain CCMP1384" /LENGTH=72 /DNA_ID=CAMNT_0043473013 /DNA_START=191 /DNA_END=406 /DNA_ORIENTATION=+